MFTKLPRGAHVALLMGVAVVLALVGCAGNDETPKDGKPKDKPTGEVTIKPVTFAKWKEVIASHKGQVVVVDIWASWCVPCKKEFHHLVELHQKYAPEGVVCISLSVDEAENEGKALAFLKEKGAAFPNYRTSEEDWGEKFGIGAIPAVRVYDKNGKETKFTREDGNTFGYESDVEPFVKKLLK